MCAEHSSGETAVSGGDVRDGFIYVYNMPSQFTEDLTQLPVQWHPSQYDYDQVSMAPSMPPSLSIFAQLCKQAQYTIPISLTVQAMVFAWLAFFSRLFFHKTREACSSPHTGVAKSAPMLFASLSLFLASAAAIPAGVPSADRPSCPCSCSTSTCCRAGSGRRTLIRRSCCSSPSIWAATSTGSGSSGAPQAMPGTSMRSAFPRTPLRSASGTNGTAPRR